MAKYSAKTAHSTSSATDGIKKFFLTSPRPFIIIVALLAFAVFSNSLLNDFVYDDEGQVLGNHWIKSGKYIPEIFSKGVWEFKKDATTTNYYRPMMHIVYMLNYHLFGLKPWGFHLMNILFHAGVSVLVLLIGVRLMKESQPSFSLSFLSPPFMAAVLFATHPIHTEAVTWIAALPEVMFAFFCLLSFYFYGKTGADGISRHLFSLLFFAVALLCKETAVTFPLVLIAYDIVIKKEHTRSGHFKRYIPYILVGGLYLLVRYYVLKGFAPHSQMRLSTFDYLLNIFPLFTSYLLKLLLPVNLTVAHAQYPISSLFEAKGLLSLSATVLFLVLSFIAYKKNRLIFFGLVLMVVPLLPALYMPGISFHFGDGGRYLLPFSERYLYLPSFGFVMVASLFMAETMRNRTKALAIALALITVLYSAGTIKRNVVWKDNYSLWTDAVKKSPNIPLTHIMLGIAYDKREMMDDAMKEYQYVLDRNPDNAEAFHNMGISYAKKGMTDTAVEYYLKALKLRPDFYETHFNLGDAYLKQGMLDKAVEQYQRAIQLKPEFAEAYVNLGIAYGMSGAFEKAMEYFRTAIAFNPDLAQAHVNYGIALGRTGALDRAIEEYQAALRSQPDSIRANRNLGEAFLQKGLMAEAIRQFEISVSLEPDSPQAHFLLGNTLYNEGSLDKAIAELEAAVRLDPGLAEAQKQLGEALYRKGSFDKAIEHLQRAVNLDPASIEAQKNLGDVYFEKNLLDQAIDQYKIVLRLRPEFVGTYYNLGVAFYRKGLTERAIEHFKTAVKLQPEFAAAHNALGVAYRKLGQKEKARGHFQEAVKLNPADQGFLKNLASVQ